MKRIEIQQLGTDAWFIQWWTDGERYAYTVLSPISATDTDNTASQALDLLLAYPEKFAEI